MANQQMVERAVGIVRCMSRSNNFITGSEEIMFWAKRAETLLVLLCGIGLSSSVYGLALVRPANASPAGLELLCYAYTEREKL